MEQYLTMPCLKVVEHVFISKLSGWWLGHPSEKYEFVNWDD